MLSNKDLKGRKQTHETNYSGQAGTCLTNKSLGQANPNPSSISKSKENPRIRHPSHLLQWVYKNYLLSVQLDLNGDGLLMIQINRIPINSLTVTVTLFHVQYSVLGIDINRYILCFIHISGYMPSVFTLNMFTLYLAQVKKSICLL